MINIDKNELAGIGVQFGNLARRWNPRMHPYIFKKINRIHILDLDKIFSSCQKVDDYIKSLIEKKKTILFLSTKNQAQKVVKEAAKSFRNLIKKDQVSKLKKKNKLLNIYEGIVGLKTPPNALFIIGLHKEKTAFKEAKKMGIPVIAVCNSNCNPQLVDYVIPDLLRAAGINETELNAGIEEYEENEEAEEILGPDESDEGTSDGPEAVFMRNIKSRFSGSLVSKIFGKNGKLNEKLKEVKIGDYFEDEEGGSFETKKMNILECLARSVVEMVHAEITAEDVPETKKRELKDFLENYITKNNTVNEKLVYTYDWMEIPLRKIIGEATAGAVIEDTITHGNLSNPLTVKITKFGGRAGNYAWIRGQRHLSTYEIEPFKIETEQGEIEINSLLLTYQRDNFEDTFGDADKTGLIRAEIPGFMDENNLNDGRKIGGEGGSKTYSLQIFNDYILVLPDGRFFPYNENSLTALISQAQNQNGYSAVEDAEKLTFLKNEATNEVSNIRNLSINLTGASQTQTKILNQAETEQIETAAKKYHEVELEYYLRSGEIELNQVRSSELEKYIEQIKRFSESASPLEREIWEEVKDNRVEIINEETLETESPAQLGAESRLNAIQQKLKFVNYIPQVYQEYKKNADKVFTAADLRDFENFLDRLENLREDTRNKVEEYTEIGKKFAEIDRKTEYDEVVFLDDLFYLKNLIPNSEHPGYSLTNKLLTPAEIQFYTNNKKEVDLKYLWLFKQSYIQRNNQFLTEFELTYIESEQAKLEELIIENEVNEAGETQSIFKMESFIEEFDEVILILEGIQSGTIGIENDTEVTEMIRESLTAAKTEQELRQKITQMIGRANNDNLPIREYGTLLTNLSAFDLFAGYEIDPENSGNLYNYALADIQKLYEEEFFDIVKQRTDFIGKFERELTRLGREETEETGNLDMDIGKVLRYYYIGIDGIPAEKMAKSFHNGWLADAKKVFGEGKEPNNIESGFIFFVVNEDGEPDLEVNYSFRGETLHSLNPVEISKKEVEFYIDLKLLAEEETSPLIKELIDNNNLNQISTHYNHHGITPEQILVLKKRNVLTENKAIIETHEKVKEKFSAAEEKAIFDHPALDTPAAIQATEELLNQIKEHVGITASTANQARAAVRRDLALNELNRLRELENLHTARRTCLANENLSEREKLLFNEEVNNQTEKLDTVAKVNQVNNLLKTLREIYNKPIDSYQTGNISHIFENINTKNTLKREYDELAKFFPETATDDQKVVWEAVNSISEHKAEQIYIDVGQEEAKKLKGISPVDIPQQKKELAWERFFTEQAIPNQANIRNRRPNEFEVSGFNLLIHPKQQRDNLVRLLIKIKTAPDLATCRAIKIDDTQYDPAKVPAKYSYDRNGIDEARVAKLGWEITPDYQIRDKKIINYRLATPLGEVIEPEIMVERIDYFELEAALAGIVIPIKNLVVEIKAENLTIADFPPDLFETEIDNLNETLLPPNRSKDNLRTFRNEERQKLVDEIFIIEFKAQRGEAANVEERDNILTYRNKKTLDNGTEIEISGTQAGKKVYPLTTSFAQAQKEIWIDAFHG
ncbi:10715_t:CDS:10, partial [Funneliformis geosporum]